MNGIPQVIIDRANEIATMSARGENLVAACAKMSAEETDALEEAVCTFPIAEKNKTTWVESIDSAHICVSAFCCIGNHS